MSDSIVVNFDYGRITMKKKCSKIIKATVFEVEAWLDCIPELELLYNAYAMKIVQTVFDLEQ